MDEEEIVEDDLYEVECFLSTRKKDGKRFYKVRWKGFPPEEDTWEPEENVEECTEALEAFWAKQKAARKQKKKRYTIIEEDDDPSTSNTTPASPLIPDDLLDLGLTRQATKELQQARMKQTDPPSVSGMRDFRQNSSDYQSSESDAYDLGDGYSRRDQDVETVDVMSQGSSVECEEVYHKKQSKNVVINLLSDSDSDYTKDESDGSSRRCSSGLGLPTIKSPDISQHRPMNRNLSIPTKSPMLSQYTTSGDEPMGLGQEFSASESLEDPVLQSPEFHANKFTSEDFQLTDLGFPEFSQNIYSELPSENESGEERSTETSKTRHSVAQGLVSASAALVNFAKKAEAESRAKSSYDTKEYNSKVSEISNATDKEQSSLEGLPKPSTDVIPTVQADLKSPIFERPKQTEDDIKTPIKSSPTKDPLQTPLSSQDSEDFDISPKRKQRFSLSLKKKNRKKRYEYHENSARSEQQQETDSESGKDETTIEQSHELKLESLREKMAELEKTEKTNEDVQAEHENVSATEVDELMDLGEVSQSVTQLKDIMYKIADEKDSAEKTVSTKNDAKSRDIPINASIVTQSTSNAQNVTDSSPIPKSTISTTSGSVSVTQSSSLCTCTISSNQETVTLPTQTSNESDTNVKLEKITSEMETTGSKDQTSQELELSLNKSSPSKEVKQAKMITNANDTEFEKKKDNFVEVKSEKGNMNKAGQNSPKRANNDTKVGLATETCESLHKTTTNTDKNSTTTLTIPQTSDSKKKKIEKDAIITTEAIGIIHDKDGSTVMDIHADNQPQFEEVRRNSNVVTSQVSHPSIPQPEESPSKVSSQGNQRLTNDEKLQLPSQEEDQANKSNDFKASHIVRTDQSSVNISNEDGPPKRIEGDIEMMELNSMSTVERTEDKDIPQQLNELMINEIERIESEEVTKPNNQLLKNTPTDRTKQSSDKLTATTQTAQEHEEPTLSSESDLSGGIKTNQAQQIEEPKLSSQSELSGVIKPNHAHQIAEPKLSSESDLDGGIKTNDTQQFEELTTSSESYLVVSQTNDARHTASKDCVQQTNRPVIPMGSDQEMSDTNQMSNAQQKTPSTSATETLQQTTKVTLAQPNKVLKNLQKLRQLPSFGRSCSVPAYESNDDSGTKEKDSGKILHRSTSMVLNASNRRKENCKDTNSETQNKKSEYMKFFGIENSSNESSDDGKKDGKSAKIESSVFSSESSDDDMKNSIYDVPIIHRISSIVKNKITTSQASVTSENELTDDRNCDDISSAVEEINQRKPNTDGPNLKQTKDNMERTTFQVERLLSGTDVDSDDLAKSSHKESHFSNTETKSTEKSEKSKNRTKEKEQTSTQFLQKNTYMQKDSKSKKQKSEVSSGESNDKSSDIATEEMDLSENEDTSEDESAPSNQMENDNQELDKKKEKDQATESEEKANSSTPKSKDLGVKLGNQKLVSSKKVVKKKKKAMKSLVNSDKDNGNKPSHKTNKMNLENRAKGNENKDNTMNAEMDKVETNKKNNKTSTENEAERNKNEDDAVNQGNLVDQSNYENNSNQLDRESITPIEILDSSADSSNEISSEKANVTTANHTNSQKGTSKKVSTTQKHKNLKKRKLKSSSSLNIHKKKKLSSAIDGESSDVSTASSKQNEQTNSHQRTNSNKCSNEAQNSPSLNSNVDSSVASSLVSGDLIGTILDEGELGGAEVNGIEATSGEKTADNGSDMDIDDGSDLEIELEDFPLENLLDEDVSELREIPSPPVTPLQLTYADVKQAIRDGDEESVRAALAGGLELNELDGASGMTLLMMASLACQDHVVELLLRRRADVNAAQKNGMTALMHACEQGCPETAHILLMCGADINKQQINGETALMKACKKNHTDVVEVLLKHGADTKVETKGGQTVTSVPGLSDEILLLLEEHEKRLTTAIEQAISTCLGDEISVCKPPVFAYRCISPNQAQHFNFPFNYTAPKQTAVKKDVILFCIKANFTDDLMSLTFGEDNGIRGVVLNGKTQVPLLHGIRSIFSIEPKQGTNKFTVQTHKCSATTKLIACIYTIQPS